MTKTQIQLPDETYLRLKELAKRLEVSLAELLRRGAEYMLSIYPEPTPEWTLPPPVRLGEPRVPHEEWRLLANESARDERS